jgi:hypothetical protein
MSATAIASGARSATIVRTKAASPESAIGQAALAVPAGRAAPAAPVALAASEALAAPVAPAALEARAELEALAIDQAVRATAIVPAELAVPAAPIVPPELAVPAAPVGLPDAQAAAMAVGLAAASAAHDLAAASAAAAIAAGAIGGFGGGHRGGGGGGRWRSDLRLKHDLVLLGRLDDGLGYYRFVYNGGHTAYVGVMAQEVETVMPKAVSVGADGYLRVSYDMLGLPFETYVKWLADGAHLPSGAPDAR